MNTYVVSSLNRNEKKAMRSLSLERNFEELFSTAPSTINFDGKFSGDENYIFIFSDEKVALSFSYLNEKRFFDLNTVNILNLDRMEIMLSLVKGIGILGRGGPLKYISSEIGPLIGSSLFNNSKIFEMKEFYDREMEWDNWEGKLLAITFKLPDVKSISVEGKKVESKIKELELYPSDSNEIVRIKVYNEKFNREITIQRNGKIRIALWPGEVGIHGLNKGEYFSKFVEKMIEFYEYVEGALGEGS